MTWWQIVLQYVVPICLGLSPTIYLLNTARRKAGKEVVTEDATASTTYMQAATGMAQLNKDLQKRIDDQDTEIDQIKNEFETYKKETSRQLLKQGAEIDELIRGIRILCAQLRKADMPPDWTLDKRTFGRISKQ